MGVIDDRQLALIDIAVLGFLLTDLPSVESKTLNFQPYL